MRWKVTYIKEDEDRRIHYTEEVEAVDYTKAYMKFLFEHPKTHMIIKLVPVEEGR